MSFKSKHDKLKQIFSSCNSPEDCYKKIIQLGNALLPLDPSFKTEANRVQECQSALYLHTLYENEVMIFTAEADALISKGLAALLIAVYNHEAPVTIIKHPPTYLIEIGIPQSLSPSRSNGLSSLFLRMQQEAIKYFSRSN